MTNPNCVHCGARLTEYRGSWFSRGDEVRCLDGETRHAPPAAEAMSPTTIAGRCVFLSHGDDGFLVAHCSDLPGVVTQGFGRRATLAAMEVAIANHVPTLAAPEVVADNFGSAPRASIVAFLTSEARRFDAESKEASRDRGNASERLRAQASLLRTLAAQIARGDDRLGGDPTPSDLARFGAAADREVEQ